MEVATAIIGGEQIATNDAFLSLDPSSGRPLSAVARGQAKDVERAVAAARHALPSWRATPVSLRGRLMAALAAAIREEAEPLALLESRDTGKPLSQARADVEAAGRYFEFAGGAVQTLYGEAIPIGENVLAYTRREAHGVTGHIIPWNYPLQVTARTVSASVATGNCCVLKPAEEASLTPIRLGLLALEVGIPPGVFNVVPGFGREAGAALAGHKDVNHLSFTGSVEIGQQVAAAAARHVVPVTLELGGKSPNIVFADANLDVAVPAVVASILQNAGQTCSAGSRLLVDERIHDEVIDRIHDRFVTTTIGPGVEDPQLGPLISERQRDRVRDLVTRATEEARLITGGESPDDDRLRDGWFYRPTLFDQVSVETAIGREEVFGPVLAVSSFTDTAGAVELANATDYGLIAAVWSADVDRAHWVAAQLDVGQVFVNNYGAGGGVELPFGGVKQSGYGREKGLESLRGYTRVKTVAVRTCAPGDQYP